MVNEEGALDGLHIEGIYFSECFSKGRNPKASTLSNILFKRCYFNKLAFWDWDSNSAASTYLHNLKIVNCVIGTLLHDPAAKNAGVYNCIIGKSMCINTSYCKELIIKNCIIFKADNFGCVYKDNIFMSNNNYDFDDDKETASFFSHNIATNADYFKNIDENRNENNWAGKTSIGIFGEDVGNGYDSKYSYKLKEGNASIYVGSDGKEVGIYGGDYPFSKIPSNPQILSKEIDVQTTTDGKLKVSVKIEAQP